MTLPEGAQPSGPTIDPSSTPVTGETPEQVVAEDASDAQLRAWAKENGVTGVPSGGRLSASWRDQITTAMAAALDPKGEASVEVTSSPSPDPEMTPESSEGEAALVVIEESPRPVQPEFDNPYGEYRSVFKAPDTFVSSQTYTS